MGISFKLLVSQLTASEIPASAARGASHIYLNLVTSPGEARREKRSHTTRRDTTCCPPHPGYGPVTVPELGSFCKVQAVLQPHADTPADLLFLAVRWFLAEPRCSIAPAKSTRPGDGLGEAPARL